MMNGPPMGAAPMEDGKLSYGAPVDPNANVIESAPKRQVED